MDETEKIEKTCRWCGYTVRRHPTFGWVHEATAHTNGRVSCCSGRHRAEPRPSRARRT